MRTNRRLVLVAVTAFAGTSLLSAIAAADEGTVVTFEALAGTLAISQADDGLVTLDPGSVLATAPAVSGGLDDITVTDSQALVGVWCVSVGLSDANATGGPGFESGANEISGANVRMWVEAGDLVGTGMTLATTNLLWASGLTMDNGGTLVNGVTILGGGSVTYTPQLGVDLDGAATGTYTGTITHTLTSGVLTCA